MKTFPSADFCVRTIFTLLLALILFGASSAQAFTAAEATAIWNSFNSAFYVGNGGNAYYLNIHGGSKLTLWQQAETIEMACDREEVSGSSADQAIGPLRYRHS